MADSNFLSSLLCHETETGLNNDDDEVNEYTPGVDDEDEDEEECLLILFNKEIRDFELVARQFSISEWIKRARLDSIQWILSTRVSLGFRLQTAYLSLIYFDRFLSIRMIDNEKHWAIQLLSVACLSLAAKMEECKVPALPEFQSEEYNFESKVLQRMELLVLNTLQWRMVSVTPFHYLHYIASKLCPQSSSQRNVVTRRTIGLIFDITKDTSLMRHRSSSIAVAATLVAMDLQLTRQSLEMKMNDISINRFLELEDVHSCYSGLLEKIKLPVASPELSPVGRRINVFENLRVPSAVGTKRKRLTFSDSDQDCSLPGEKGHRHC